MRSALVLAFLLFVGSISAQTVKVNVKDSQGEPIIGASVVEKDTKNGGVTDFDGNFTIKLTANKPVVVSYIGMKTKTIDAKGKSELSVVLEDDNTQLEEVVAIGYGTVRKKDLTGAVSQVNSKQLENIPVSNVSEALTGKMAGVNITTTEGSPDADVKIRVRGGGSLSQDNSPLYIVDGFEVSSISDIAPSEIETIDVLKDASSTAIYGARGANGVILITTKGGQEGKAKVKYNMYYQIKSKPDFLDVQSAYDNVLYNWGYAKMQGDSYADGVAKYYGLGSAYGNHLNDYKNQKAHNYMDDVLRTTHAWNHDVSVSGGSKTTKFYAAVNYSDNEGALVNSAFRRWGANLKLTQDITSTLRLDVDARYSEMQFKGNRYEFATQAYRYRPEPKGLSMGR